MNSSSAFSQKNAIRQLLISLGATISNKQRQTLVEIYIALDNASRASSSSVQTVLPHTTNHSACGVFHE